MKKDVKVIIKKESKKPIVDKTHPSPYKHEKLAVIQKDLNNNFNF
jgi:hypothetical protein